MQHFVFVYGTLRRGERNHALLADARYVGEGKTAAGFTLLNLGPYPAAVAASHLHSPSIRGEVYEVDDGALASLDRLEGCPALYFREQQPIRLQAGGTLNAWMYLLTSGEPAGATVISSGDWRDRT
jgi:gamma-glutamylaminecyclotransferase